MTLLIFITILTAFLSPASYGQPQECCDLQNGLCAHEKKYEEPERKKIHFPARQISDNDKTEALREALPDSFGNEDSDYYREYYFYLGEKEIIDYDPAKNILYYVQNKLPRILKDQYFFDISGDGLLDFIYYPQYCKLLNFDADIYELFIRKKDGGYKIVPFWGYITDIKFSGNGALQEMTTLFFEGGGNGTYYIFNYTYDHKTDELIRTTVDTFFECQLIEKERYRTADFQ